MAEWRKGRQAEKCSHARPLCARSWTKVQERWALLDHIASPRFMMPESSRKAGATTRQPIKSRVLMVLPLTSAAVEGDRVSLKWVHAIWGRNEAMLRSAWPLRGPIVWFGNHYGRRRKGCIGRAILVHHWLQDLQGQKDRPTASPVSLSVTIISLMGCADASISSQIPGH